MLHFNLALVLLFLHPMGQNPITKSNQIKPMNQIKLNHRLLYHSILGSRVIKKKKKN